MNSLRRDLKELSAFIIVYQTRKLTRTAKGFEQFKNLAVEMLMIRRGRFQKHVWHSSVIGLTSVGVLTSGVLGGSINAQSMPGVTSEDPRLIQTYDPNAGGVSLSSLVSLNTQVSDKPRPDIESYTVQSGDTISEIADKYGISVDTVKWANNLDDIQTVKPGDVLKILPVSGVAVAVKSGDTLQSLAKKYSVDADTILQWPYNDIPDDLSLTIGQQLIIPDGVPPEKPAPPKPRVTSPLYLANGSNVSGPSFSAPGGGDFMWPTSFVYISTYFSWWHPGIDLPNPASPPIHAADSGTVVYAGWDNTGYGNRVDIDHGNGYLTRYAHLSNIYVTVGQSVTHGQVIGQMGSTGRSTGTHLHFEIHYRGVAINPLSILK